MRCVRGFKKIKIIVFLDNSQHQRDIKLALHLHLLAKVPNEEETNEEDNAQKFFLLMYDSIMRGM